MYKRQIKINSDFKGLARDISFTKSKQEELNLLSSSHSFSPENGDVIGEHSGAYYYTIGQRKGLNIGGFKEPLFVIETDVINNVVYVGMGEKHPALFKMALFVNSKDIHWVRDDLKIKNNQSLEVDFRVRYRQPLQSGTIHKYDEGLYLLFKKPVSSVTSGQFVSWYIDEELIGSGVIN